MKTFKFLFLVTVFVLANSQIDEDAELATRAIQEALQNHFAPNEPKVDLYFYGPNSAVMTGELMQKISAEVSVQVTRLDTVKDGFVLFKAPSIVLCDSGVHFKEIAKVYTWNVKNGVWPNILIYAPHNVEVVYDETVGNATKQVIHTFDVLAHYAESDFDIENVNFISVTSKTTADLIASFRYSPGKCNSPQYRIINRFSSDNMKWQNEEFFPDKYKNLYGCPLRVGYFRTNRFSYRKLYEILAHVLNFEIEWEEIRLEGQTAQYVTENFDVIDYQSVQNSIKFESFEFSAPIFSDSVTFTVPVGEPYTQLEKMFLMFDKATWICIGATLAASVLVILIINFMPVIVQNFVFGRNIRTAMLNLVSIFLNGGQHRVPGRNFSRYMLTMFVIWSLIIRTCYQSELYKNLQTDMRRPRVQSIDELNEKNFTLMYRTEDEEFLEDIAIKRFKLTQKVSAIPEDRTFIDFENKLTKLVQRKLVRAEFSAIGFTDSSYHVLVEDTASIHVSLMFLRSHRLSKTFIKHIDRLISSGVAQKLDELLQLLEEPLRKVEDQKPEPLTMDHVGVCFIAILICLALSCIAFMFECVTKYM